MFPFLIEFSFSEAKNPVNLLYPSFPQIKGRTSSLWDSLLLSGPLAPASLAPLFPGSLISHINPPIDTAFIFLLFAP